VFDADAVPAPVDTPASVGLDGDTGVSTDSEEADSAPLDVGKRSVSVKPEDAPVETLSDPSNDVVVGVSPSEMPVSVGERSVLLRDAATVLEKPPSGDRLVSEDVGVESGDLVPSVSDDRPGIPLAESRPVLTEVEVVNVSSLRVGKDGVADGIIPDPEF